MREATTSSWPCRTDRQARDFPFGKSVFKSTRPITPLTERRDGLERQDAPRAPAIRYNLSIRRKLRQRYIQCAGANGPAGTRPRDAHRGLPPSRLSPIQQLDAADRLQVVTGAE